MCCILTSAPAFSLALALTTNAPCAAYYPACYAPVLSVAATNNVGVAAPFTNYGTFVDICAPGVGIYSTALGGGYATLSGTSFATPQVFDAFSEP